MNKREWDLRHRMNLHHARTFIFRTYVARCVYCRKQVTLTHGRNKSLGLLRLAELEVCSVLLSREMYGPHVQQQQPLTRETDR